MKKITRLVAVALMVLGLTISACDKRSDVTRDNLTFEGINTEEVLNGEDKAELSKMLGNLTFGEVLDLLGNSLKTLNILAEKGKTEKEDYQTLLNIIKNTHTYLLEQKAEYDADPDAYNEAHPESSNAMSELLKIAVDAKVGVLLNQVIKQAGSQCVTQNIYPMIAYALTAEDDILKNAFSGSTDSSTTEKITRGEFDTLIGFANNLINPDGKYYKMHDSISSFRSTLDTEANPVTVDDVRALYDSLDILAGPYAGSTDDETVKGPYSSEQSKKIWEKAGTVLKQTWKDDTKIRSDAVSLSNSLSQFIIAPGLDSTMAGFADVLSTDPEVLKAFVTKALAGLSHSSGSASMNELMPYLATINRDDIPGIAKGVKSALNCNMYGQEKASARVKISELRALMYMMQEAHSPDNVLNKLGIINLMSSQDDKYIADYVPGFIPTKNYTTNVAEWTIGEVVSAIKYFKAADKGDASAALNWVLYEKNYDLLGFDVLGTHFAPIKYKGQVGMMTDDMMKMFREDNSISIAKLMNAEGVDGIIDPFPAFVELAGGRRDGTEDAWKNSANASGVPRHRLFALFAPLMQSAWENDIKNRTMNRTYGTVDMLAQLNEIGHDEYVSLTDTVNATFVNDDKGVIMKAAENALASALNNNDQTEFLAPVLDLALTLVNRLYYTTGPISNTSLLTSIVNDLNMQPSTSKTQGETITKLFVDKDENGNTLIDNAGNLLDTRNQATIANFAKVMGKSMINSDIAGVLVYDLSLSLIDDYDKISPIITKMIPASTSDDTEDTSTLTELMDYLTAKINNGKDENPFILNGWKIIYKALDVQDNIYNPAGYIRGSKTVTGPDSLLLHLSDIYEVKKYTFMDAEPIITFLTDVTGTQQGTDALWSIFDSSFNNSDSSDMLKKIMGSDGAGDNYIKISIEPRFVRALFTSVDNNADGLNEDSVALSILKQIDMSYVNGDREFMQRILGEAMELTKSTGTSLFKPGSEDFDNLVLTLDNLLKNISVK
jgi:hypothetical protein